MTDAGRDCLNRRFFLRSAMGAGAGLATQPVIGRAALHESSRASMQALIDSASRLDRLQSLVVLEDDQVVVAEPFSIADIQTPVNIKSVSKSVLSALAGIALERGVFDSVTATLGELAPQLIPRRADPKIGQLTIENLLTMQTGLQRTSGRYYGAWVNSDDWVAYVLTRRFVAEPGTQMFYSTGDWHVLGAVLSALTGQSLLSLARQWLGKPLNISFAPWTRDKQGRYLGGNEMAMSPLDLARFGQLYLSQGGQVLSGDWVKQSLTPRTRSPWSGDQYGYGWFIRDHSERPYYYGRGYGGQFVFVLPSSNRIVVMTSDWRQPARGGVYTEDLHDLVVRYCL
ncbi:MAG: serine hydrolase domain-containing protein [Burkholderiaceae bacterium]